MIVVMVAIAILIVLKRMRALHELATTLYKEGGLILLLLLLVLLLLWLHIVVISHWDLRRLDKERGEGRGGLIRL